MDAASAPAQQGVQPSRPAKKRTGTSKYDFIKVKVWLGENLDHYYILSRFLICRMLTVTRIPYIKAVKIALETKKHLVDNNLHDVTQAQLEEVLFSIIREKGFDEAHIDCYRMVTQFYQSRQPLCIIICGAAWTGKSTLAQQLASRINIPNVMQTDVIYELLRAGPDSPLNPVPLWARPGLAGGRCCDAALVREFRREARVVREGMEGDLIKTLSDGKPIIIEGLHLDPGLYIPDLGSRGLILLPARPTAAMTAAAAVTAAGGGLQAAAAAGRSPGSSPQVGRGRYGRCQTLPARPSPAAVDAAAFATGVAGGGVSREEGGEGSADGDDVSTQQQQQDGQDDKQGESEQQEQLYQQQQQLPLMGLQGRSVSASAEVSVSAAGPLSPGSLQPGSGSVSAEAALGLLRSSAAATYTQQQQHQQQQQGLMPQQQQGLLRTLEESSQQQQQLPSLPPLPPLRLHRRQQQQQQQEQNLLTMTALNGHAACITSSGSGSTVQTALSRASIPNPSNPLPVQQRGSSQQGQHLGTPFADAAAANAAAAVSTAATAGEYAAAGPAGLCSSPDGLPVAMTGEEVQVCAAAAEAAALQQHRQELQASHQQQQLQQQQQGRHPPGSPFSSASDVSSVGVGGGSPPCISQEHSTTEVVSRVCSCASLGSPSLPLSQEPSGAADVWSAAAAAASAADGVGCGALLCKQSSGSGGMGLRAGGFHTRSSARASSRQLGQLPEEQHGEGLSPPQQQPGAATQRKQQQVQQSVQQQQQQQPSTSLPAYPHPHQQQKQQQQSKCNGTIPAGLPQPEGQVAAGILAVGTDGENRPESVADRLAPRKAARHAATPRDVQANGDAALQQHAAAAAVTGVAVEARSCQVPAQQQQQHPQLEAATAHGSAAQPAPVQLSHPQQQAQQPDCQQPQQLRLSEQQPQQQQQQGMPPPEPCISSGAGKAKAGQEGEPNVGKPLFVPILVYMDEADHALMADEALSHLGLPAGKSAGGAAAAGGEAVAGAGGDGDSLSDGQTAADGSNGGAGRGCMHDGADAVWQQQQSGVTVDEALRRVRLLQEYLCAYEAQGLPVVKVSYGAFGEALDKLHEYVLQCIKVAMQSREAASE